MQEVRRTITIELEVDLVGTFVPGEAASKDCTFTDPMIADLYVEGITSDRPFMSSYPGSRKFTDNILYGVDMGSESVYRLLSNIADLGRVLAKDAMLDDAIRGADQ